MLCPLHLDIEIFMKYSSRVQIYICMKSATEKLTLLAKLFGKLTSNSSESLSRIYRLSKNWKKWTYCFLFCFQFFLNKNIKWWLIRLFICDVFLSKIYLKFCKIWSYVSINTLIRNLSIPPRLDFIDDISLR